MDGEAQKSGPGVGAGLWTEQPIITDGNIAKVAYTVGRDIHIFDTKAVKEVAEADPSNIQQVAASQLAIIGSYYKSVLWQAQQSFLAALVASIIGLIFFIAAVSFLLLQKPESVSIISLVSGTLVEVIAGINFYLYGQASKQFATFHTRLDRTQNFLLANSVCTNLQDGEIKETSRAELIRLIANASLTRGNDEKKEMSDKAK